MIVRARVKGRTRYRSGSEHRSDESACPWRTHSDAHKAFFQVTPRPLEGGLAATPAIARADAAALNDTGTPADARRRPPRIVEDRCGLS